MPLRRWMVVLWSAAALLNALTLGMVFGYAPVEVQMGAVQKIYLWKEEAVYDTVAHAMAEVGWIFITIVLVTGPIWGRSAWGKWWVWEPRLTSFLVLWLMYSAYFLLRLFSAGETRTAKIAAVVAIVAFFDVPIVHKAISWWGSIVHPRKVTLEAPMRQTFFVAMVAVFVLASAMVITRLAVGLAEARRGSEGAAS
jgi:heme exporter protein C